MTFLVENEEAALVVPARFLGQVHPHFREIQQVLAVTVADEARHIEVFTRRATLTGHELALSTVGGRASLQTLLDEPDYAIAIVPAVGDGRGHVRLAARRSSSATPPTRSPGGSPHLARARRGPPRRVRAGPPRAPRRPRARPARPPGRAPSSAATTACTTTAGLNDDVFDALVLLAAGERDAGGRSPRGWAAVQELQAEMDDGRRARLARLGFTAGEADDALGPAHPQLHVTDRPRGCRDRRCQEPWSRRKRSSSAASSSPVGRSPPGPATRACPGSASAS